MKFRIKNLFFVAALLLLSSGCGVFTAPGEDSSDTHSPGKPESGDVPGLSLEQEAAKKLLADLLYQDMKLIDDDS